MTSRLDGRDMVYKRKGRRAAIDRSGMTREEYAIEYLVKKHGVSVERARRLVEHHGTDLVKLKEAAGVAKSAGV